MHEEYDTNLLQNNRGMMQCVVVWGRYCASYIVIIDMISGKGDEVKTAQT